VAIDPQQKQRWLNEFHLNGFVILREFLPVEFVRAMHEELMPLLAAEHAKAVQDNFQKGRMPGRLSLHIAPFADMMRGALADARYRRNPIIEELVDALIGAGRWQAGWTVVEAVWKGAAFMPFHSDQKIEDTPDPDGPHETIRVTYNIPLVPFTWASGAMELIPGSHHLPRRFPNTFNFLEIRDVYSTRLELRLGDALLRDGNTLHRGTPNLTDEPRPMLDQTYKRVIA
jgi:hypothetical protein